MDIQSSRTRSIAGYRLNVLAFVLPENIQQRALEFLKGLNQKVIGKGKGFVEFRCSRSRANVDNDLRHKSLPHQLTQNPRHAAPRRAHRKRRDVISYEVQSRFYNLL